ncbi:hypothetical protein ABSA28_00441 [Candidatus Hepatincolaceae symbiont of Richtersius coronifer]
MFILYKAVDKKVLCSRWRLSRLGFNRNIVLAEKGLWADYYLQTNLLNNIKGKITSLKKFWVIPGIDLRLGHTPYSSELS